jgi:hypothetical protein
MRSENRNSGLRRKMDEIDYQIHHAFENQSTNEFVSEDVKTLISRLLPGATRITVDDYPGDLSGIYGVDIETLSTNRNLLYIHYPKFSDYYVGGGNLLIIDKDSLEVIYNGDDGGE